MSAFNLTTNDVIECSIYNIAEGQTILNRFDLIIGGGGVATTNDLDSAIGLLWGAIALLISDRSTSVQRKYQRVQDAIISTAGNPKRVYDKWAKLGSSLAFDGLAAGSMLPLGTTVSCQIQTASNPGKFWGRKAFGPLPETTTNIDGESILAATRTAWNTAVTPLLATTAAIGVTGFTFRGGVWPTTFVANQVLPHTAPNLYFQPCTVIDIGFNVGSQETRRVNPFGLLGH